MLELENKNELEHKITNIEKLINRYAELRLITKDEGFKRIYENLSIELNKEKVAIKTFLI